jgi:hypothetical protein
VRDVHGHLYLCNRGVLYARHYYVHAYHHHPF